MQLIVVINTARLTIKLKRIWITCGILQNFLFNSKMTSIGLNRLNYLIHFRICLKIRNINVILIFKVAKNEASESLNYQNCEVAIILLYKETL